MLSEGAVMAPDFGDSAGPHSSLTSLASAFRLAEIPANCYDFVKQHAA